MSFIDEGMTDPSAGAYALTGGFCRSEERLMDHKYPSDEAERRRAKRSEGQLVHRTVEAEAHDLSADRCESVSPFHTACVLVSGHRIPHCGPRQETSRYRERWA